jgi:hypothetical protein
MRVSCCSFQGVFFSVPDGIGHLQVLFGTPFPRHIINVQDVLAMLVRDEYDRFAWDYSEALDIFLTQHKRLGIPALV